MQSGRERERNANEMPAEAVSPRDWGAHPPYVYPGYRSTTLRGPKRPLIPLKHTLSELTGPVFGHECVGPLDSDLTRNGARNGEPLGELTEAETLPTPPGMQYVSLWGLSFVRLVDHLVPAVLDGAPVAPAATFRDGVAVQRVLDAVRQSSRSGWVPV